MRARWESYIGLDGTRFKRRVGPGVRIAIRDHHSAPRSGFPWVHYPLDLFSSSSEVATQTRSRAEFWPGGKWVGDLRKASCLDHSLLRRPLTDST